MSQRPIHVNLADGDLENIKAQDDAAWIAGLLNGGGSTISCILPYGDNLSVSKVNNNKIKMSSGVYIMQGHAIKIPDQEDFTISSGTVGKNRIDLIVAEYRKGTDRDSYQIKVIKGSLYSGTPQKPTLQQENLFFGGSVRQEELAVVRLSGLDITSVALTATRIKGLADVAQQVSGFASAIDQKLDKTETVVNSNNLGTHPANYFAPMTKVTELLKQVGDLKTAEIEDSSISYGNPHLVLKSKWATLPRGETFRVSISSGATYSALVQKYSNAAYGSAIIFGYNMPPAFIQVSGGTWSPLHQLAMVRWGSGSPPSDLAVGEIWLEV